MDYKKLIERLREETYWLGSSQPYSREMHPKICDEAVEAITELSGKVGELEKQLSESKLNRPIELSGQGAENFALATQLSEMQQKLKEVTAERDAAIERAKKAEDQRNNLFVLLDDVCKNVRERHVDDSVCGLCEYDGASIGESGEWTCECPGFERDDCFCMKKSIREKYDQKGE